MWLRFDKKIGYITKSGLIKKLLSGYIVVLILLMSFSMIFIATTGADEAEKEAEKEVDEAEKEAKDNIKIETVLGNISKGKKTEVISENYKETDVYSVSFTPSIDLKKVKLTVAKLKYKPEEIIEIPIKNNSVYAYLDIKLTADDVYIEEDGLESMRFIFEVKWSWINENNIDKKTILLVRYHDTEWQNLTTTCLGENDTYVYYEAETPGLSTFAVVGSELIESSASYVEEAPEVPWILNMGIIASSSTMLFVVLFKARYIYLDEEDGTKGSKKRLSRKFR